MSFLTHGFEALDRLTMSDTDLSPEDQEKRAEVEVEVRASIADEQQEEQEVAAITDDVDQINVAAEQLIMSMTHYKLIATHIRTYGMARGMMAFINHDGNLNAVLDKCQIAGPRVPSCEALSITGVDSSGKIDDNALAVAAACESVAERMLTGIKVFFEKMARFAKEMWASLKQMIFNNDKNLKAAQLSLRNMADAIDFGDREAKLFKPEQYNDIKNGIVEGLKFCQECITTAEDVITSPKLSFDAIDWSGSRMAAAKKIGINYDNATGKITETMTFKPENAKIGDAYDKAKLITIVNTCIEMNNDLKNMEKSLKDMDKVCKDSIADLSKNTRMVAGKNIADYSNIASARRLISSASSVQNLLVRRAQLFINVALRINSIASAATAKKSTA